MKCVPEEVEADLQVRISVGCCRNMCDVLKLKML